jgi:hypothetical protein
VVTICPMVATPGRLVKGQTYVSMPQVESLRRSMEAAVVTICPMVATPGRLVKGQTYVSMPQDGELVNLSGGKTD